MLVYVIEGVDSHDVTRYIRARIETATKAVRKRTLRRMLLIIESRFWRGVKFAGREGFRPGYAKCIVMLSSIVASSRGVRQR